MASNGKTGSPSRRWRLRHGARRLLSAPMLLVLPVTSGTLAAGMEAPVEISRVAMASNSGGIVEHGTITLKRDKPVFTDGPSVENQKWVGEAPPDTKHNRLEGDLCERQGQVPCLEYDLVVPEGGWRLRVAIDAISESGDPNDRFWLELYGPDGTWRGESFYYETGEVMVWPSTEPTSAVERGTWTIRVMPYRVSRASFTLRTVLESEKGARRSLPRGTALLPNLRAEPPYDLTFRASPILDTPEEGRSFPFGCQTDEAVEDRVARCLRFGFGYQNNGDGPYEVQLTPEEHNPLTADVVQRIYLQDDTPWDHRDNVTKTDGSGSPYYIDRPAGTASFHPMPGHTHWHYDNIFTAVLYVVDPTSRELEEVGTAAKLGACAHDWLLVEFDRIYQDQQFRHDSGSRCDAIRPDANLPTKSELAVALSAGWADVYPVGVPDNYVAFDDHAEGEYVLRVVVDKDGRLQEKDEHDNVGYAHFVVRNCVPTACDVELIERGRGSDPWDENKVVLRGLGE